MVILCDVKAKEERIKFKREHMDENTTMKGNIGIMCRNEACEKPISEVIRNIDSRRNAEEHVQNKYGPHWEHVDVDTKDLFSHSTEIMMKCAEGVNMHAEKIKLKDKTHKNA